MHAGALYRIGCPELALAEIDDARRGGVEFIPKFLPLCLEILRDADFERAAREAETLAKIDDAGAMLLASSIGWCLA